MGVWGTGPLDNDAAADLVHFTQKAGAGGWAIVMKMLRASGSTYTHDRVAAAELVATAMGSAHRSDDRRLPFFQPGKVAGPWAKRFARQMPSNAPSLAVRAVRAALREDLGWSRPGDARRWQANLESLLRRLGGASSRSARSTSSYRSRSTALSPLAPGERLFRRPARRRARRRSFRLRY